MNTITATTPCWGADAGRPQAPTDEARDLLALGVRSPNELAPKAAEFEAAERFPRDVSGPLARPASSACPMPRSTAAAGSRTRSTCRSSRNSRAWGSAPGRQRSHPDLLPARAFRHRRAAPAGCPTCSAATCWVPIACRRPSRAPTPPRCGHGAGAPVTITWSTAQRPGSPTAGTLTSTTCSSHRRRRRARHLLPAGPGGHRRARSRTRSARWVFRPPPPPRSSSAARGPRRPAHRRGGAGLPDRVGCARQRPARDRRLRCRARPGRARCGPRLGQGAQAVRPADRGVPGRLLHPRRHGDRDRGRSRALPFGRPPAGPRRPTASKPRWRSCSPPTWRCG